MLPPLHAREKRGSERLSNLNRVTELASADAELQCHVRCLLLPKPLCYNAFPSDATQMLNRHTRASSSVAEKFFPNKLEI